MSVAAELGDLLDKWERGELDEREVHVRAEEIYERLADWPDYPEEDPRSIIIEVASELSMLDQQLITPEDIPAMRRFLEAAPGKEKQAWIEWLSYCDQTDYEKRAKELADNPYYSKGPPVFRRDDS